MEECTQGRRGGGNRSVPVIWQECIGGRFTVWRTVRWSVPFWLIDMVVSLRALSSPPESTCKVPAEEHLVALITPKSLGILTIDKAKIDRIYACFVQTTRQNIPGNGKQAFLALLSKRPHRQVSVCTGEGT